MDKEFTSFDLKHGINLHVWSTQKFKTTLIRVVLQRDLGPKVTETALVPMVLRRGSQQYPTSAVIAERMEYLYGAQFDIDIMKMGERQIIGLEIEVANDRFISTEEDLLGNALSTLQDILLNPVTESRGFKQDYVGQEKSLLRRRIEGLINDKERYAVKRCFEEMCAGERFAIHKYGRTEDLDDITPDGLYEYYRIMLSDYPISIYVAGAVEPERVRDRVQASFIFAREAGNPLTGLPAEVKEAPARPREVTEQRDVRQGVLVLGYRTGITYRDPEYDALLFFNGILGSFPHSKLFINVREKASLAYFAYSRLEGTKGLMIANAGIDPRNYSRTVEIIRKQVEAMKNGEISDEEMDATLKGLLNSLRSTYDDAGDMIHSHLLGAINNRVRSRQELISSLKKVTKDEVVKVADNVKLDTIYFLRDGAGGNDSEQ